LWVTRSALTTPASVTRMIQTAVRGGFNTLLVQVRGRGDAYYNSSLEPRAVDLARLPGFDPLALTLQLARRESLSIHAWMAVNLVSSAVDLPTSAQHVIRRQPDWLMVPRALASELRAIDPRDARYLARVAQWTRRRPTEVEGLYTSPIHPWAAAHATAVVSELVRTYEVDGVHLDYIRYPGEDFDHSRFAIQQFKSEIRPQLAEIDRKRADALERTNALAYPDLYRPQWTAFRQSRLTAMLSRIRDAVKTIRSGVIVSAAVIADHEEAAASRLQDWPQWLAESLVDVVIPMAYTQDSQRFERQIEMARSVAGDAHLWAGIGAYRLTPTATLRHIAAAGRLGADGIALFSYDAMIASPRGAEALAELGRAAFRNGSHER
jgi:uncharacterized lipoprotein YddW (UPF0748 family)